MNTFVSSPPLREEHELISVQVPTVQQRRHLAVIDRLSLRIGLWLLLRTDRRRQALTSQEQQFALAQERHRVRAAYELERLRHCPPLRLL